MKTSKWLILAVAAALSTGGLTVLKARAGESATPQRALRGQLLERAREKLGLTDNQVGQIKAQLEGEKDTLKSLIAKRHEARVGLRAAMQASDATEASVRAASAKVAAVDADLAVERLKLYGKINPILTAEQRDKVKEFQAKLDDFLDGAIDRLGERLSGQ